MKRKLEFKVYALFVVNDKGISYILKVHLIG